MLCYAMPRDVLLHLCIDMPRDVLLHLCIDMPRDVLLHMVFACVSMYVSICRSQCMFHVSCIRRCDLKFGLE
jgi:hypothetical protein